MKTTRSDTASLFGDAPETGRSLVAVLAQRKAVGKGQQAFQRLVETIARRRDELVRWQAYLLRYRQRVASEVEPLRTKLVEGQRQMVLLIDELLGESVKGRRLGKAQRAKLRQILMNLVAGLLEERDDPEIEALHDKHGEVPYAELRQAELAMTQAMLEDVMGVEVGDDHGASSTEELLRHAEAKLRERAEAEAHAAQAKQEARAARGAGAGRARADAAQTKREQASQEASQSIREVYRKLASALHPDRETDPSERQRKTTQMQRVNEAYAAKDLLALLELQLEIEQIDAEHLASVSPTRLAHFNQVLRDQLDELESELEDCLMPFRQALGNFRALTPAMVDQSLAADIARLNATVRELHDDMVAFRDPVRLRDGLRHYPLTRDDDGEDDLDPADLHGLLDAFAAMQAPPGRRAPKRRGAKS